MIEHRPVSVGPLKAVLTEITCELMEGKHIVRAFCVEGYAQFERDGDESSSDHPEHGRSDTLAAHCLRVSRALRIIVHSVARRQPFGLLHVKREIPAAPDSMRLRAPLQGLRNDNRRSHVLFLPGENASSLRRARFVARS